MARTKEVLLKGKTTSTLENEATLSEHFSDAGSSSAFAIPTHYTGKWQFLTAGESKE